MKELEIKAALASAIKNFEKEYPEWADYTLAPKQDGITVEVVSDGNKLDIQAAKELLRDFAVELKKQTLMITSQHQGDFTVGEYVYTFEEGLEDLADELESKLGNYFSNLSVSARDNKPYVRFVYIGSLTSKDKEKLLDQIKTITEQYKPVDPDDIFSDVEFEELDEVLEEIEGKDFDDMLESDDIKSLDNMKLSKSELIDIIIDILDYMKSKDIKAKMDLKEIHMKDIQNMVKLPFDNVRKIVQWIFDYRGEFASPLKVKTPKADESKEEMLLAYDKYIMDAGLSEGMTCEDIAEMHGIDLDFIMDQLEKGIKVEMEHTDDPEEAKTIAKDHLVEIPDYYDRLEEMEAEAEKEPMLSDGTEDEDDYFTVDSEEEDHEGEMAIVQLRNIISSAESLLEVLSEESELPAWIQSKLTLAEHNLEASCDYILKGLSPEEMMEEQEEQEEQEEMFADDDYVVKENIRVTPENDELIWKADRDLMKAINDGDFKKAQSLFDFIYNFDILTAAETIGQFEDLWDKKDMYQEQIYELSLYEMFDEYDN
jgi:hypothetical protein